SLSRRRPQDTVRPVADAAIRARHRRPQDGRGIPGVRADARDLTLHYGERGAVILGEAAISTSASRSTWTPRCRSVTGRRSSTSWPGYGFSGNHMPKAMAFGTRFA